MQSRTKCRLCPDTGLAAGFVSGFVWFHGVCAEAMELLQRTLLQQMAMLEHSGN